jgi:hypothetical protein
MSCKIYNDMNDIPVKLEGRVAIKLHMGEEGNPNHIPPSDVDVLVKKIEENGGSPFLVDTTTLYRKGRYTVSGYEQIARKHGFGKFEVVIARDDEWKDVDGIRVAMPVAEADSLLLLTHVTGHLTTGIGAAIKNLAMGCVVKEGKRRIHAPTRPIYDELMCIRCGACVRACQIGCLSMGDKKVGLDLNDCSSCGRCVESCPSGAMRIQPDGVAKSFMEFALAAKAVLKLFKNNEILCINSMKKITKFCDCSSPSPVVCRDLGYLAGKDPLSVDIESARMLKESGAKLDWKTWERFEDIAGTVLK